MDDLLFGFAIYQHAIAAFKWLYSDRDSQLKKELDSTDLVPRKQELGRTLELIAGREFVKYWAFDVVRLVHLIVEEWCTQRMKREDIRKNLIGDLTVATNLDPLFLSKARRPQRFRMESDPSLPNTLNRMTPSNQLPLLGIWFGSLEELGAEVIYQLREKEPNVSARTFILSRKTTHTALIESLKKTLESARFPRLFPPSSLSK